VTPGAKGAPEMGIMKNYLAKLMPAVAATLLLVACESGPEKRSAGEVFDDTAVLAKTKAALVNDPEIKGLKIDVDVKRGVVTLTGVAHSDREKKKIVDTVYGVNGVKSVQTDIRIEAPRQ
jgi:osmotically-inducible protein OsmY